MVLYGTCMGSANAHSNVNLPVLLPAGGFKHAGLLNFDTKKNYPLPKPVRVDAAAPRAWRSTASLLDRHAARAENGVTAMPERCTRMSGCI